MFYEAIKDLCAEDTACDFAAEDEWKLAHSFLKGSKCNLTPKRADPLSPTSTPLTPCLRTRKNSNCFASCFEAQQPKKLTCWSYRNLLLATQKAIQIPHWRMGSVLKACTVKAGSPPFVIPILSASKGPQDHVLNYYYSVYTEEMGAQRGREACFRFHKYRANNWNSHCYHPAEKD